MKQRIINGDSNKVLAKMRAETVHAVVTDPPYGLNSKPPEVRAMLRAWLDMDAVEVRGAGFMGHKWDALVPQPDLWAQVLRVLKPGGHALVFAHARTVGLMELSLRMAGFEIRDQIQWLNGSGFPKSHNVAIALDKAAGAMGHRGKRLRHAHGQTGTAATSRTKRHEPITDEAKTWDGYGTALKPAHEPVIVARKPLAGTMAKNVLAHGAGPLNIDACRLEGDRWPTNVMFTDAGEDLGEARRYFYNDKVQPAERDFGLADFDLASAGEMTKRKEGSAGLNNPRAGAGRTTNGIANTHPTVKPVFVMRWLCRLVCPPGGIVLDPFAGSGSTLAACALDDRKGLGIELDERHARVAQARVAAWAALAGKDDDTIKRIVRDEYKARRSARGQKSNVFADHKQGHRPEGTLWS